MGDDEELSADELLAAKDTAIAASSNITFIALTATPKAKTTQNKIMNNGLLYEPLNVSGKN